METPHSSLSPAELLTAAVKLVFKNWEAFQIGMGNHAPSEANKVIEATEKCLRDNREVDDGQELGDWIGETLDLNFDLSIEDGSLDEVGKELVSYWNLYKSQQYSVLADLLDKKVSQPTVTAPPRVEGNSSSDSET